jgi:hypothetical protein
MSATVTGARPGAAARSTVGTSGPPRPSGGGSEPRIAVLGRLDPKKPVGFSLRARSWSTGCSLLRAARLEAVAGPFESGVGPTTPGVAVAGALLRRAILERARGKVPPVRSVGGERVVGYVDGETLRSTMRAQAWRANVQQLEIVRVQ